MGGDKAMQLHLPYTKWTVWIVIAGKITYIHIFWIFKVLKYGNFHFLLHTFERQWANVTIKPERQAFVACTGWKLAPPHRRAGNFRRGGQKM